MTDDIARLARLQALEEAAALVERVGDRDDTSDIGEAASEAFNDLDGHSMNLRLEAWNAVLAKGIRDLIDRPSN